MQLLNSRPPLTVTQLNQYVKILFDADDILTDVWVTGEITNVKRYHQGSQIYFTLTDGESQINCVIFESFMRNIKFQLADGIKVSVRGKLNMYAKKGTLSLQVAYMIDQGAGHLSQAFEQLKARLLAEGLFDPARKRPLPAFPASIAFITALDSAAMNDFTTILATHTRSVRLYCVPATVQGALAPASIVSALNEAVRISPDVIVLLRGGGSAEDLAAFNSEELVRRVAGCPVPVISAVGHEIDYSLTDFAADVRAATPTHAAQLVGQPFSEARKTIREALHRARTQLQFQLRDTRRTLADCLFEMELALNRQLEEGKARYAELLHRLEMANPLRKLQQGFSINALESDQTVVRSIAQVVPGATLITRVTDGSFRSTVIEIL